LYIPFEGKVGHKEASDSVETGNRKGATGSNLGDGFYYFPSPLRADEIFGFARPDRMRPSFIPLFHSLSRTQLHTGKMGEHTPISRPSEASSSTKKVRRRKVDREALPLPVHSESMDVDEDVLDGPSTSYEASSSKLVPTPAKEVSLSKRSKGKGKLEDAVALTSAPAPVEGKRKRDKGKETARETESGLRNTVPNPASWPCVPLAQDGISRVPHVWSKDGR
jgi:hypothetical protein